MRLVRRWWPAGAPTPVGGRWWPAGAPAPVGATAAKHQQHEQRTDEDEYDGKEYKHTERDNHEHIDRHQQHQQFNDAGESEHHDEQPHHERNYHDEHDQRSRHKHIGDHRQHKQHNDDDKQHTERDHHEHSGGHQQHQQFSDAGESEHQDEHNDDDEHHDEYEHGDEHEQYTDIRHIFIPYHTYHRIHQVLEERLSTIEGTSSSEEELLEWYLREHDDSEHEEAFLEHYEWARAVAARIVQVVQSRAPPGALEREHQGGLEELESLNPWGKP